MSSSRAQLGVLDGAAVPGVDPRTGSASDGYGNWWLSSASYTPESTYPGVPYGTVHPDLCAPYSGASTRYSS